MDLSQLPALNASLNAISACLLVCGYIFIRQNSIKAHTMCMVCAFCVSILFLISYVYYHFHQGSTPFTGQGWIRIVYFTVLISHIILAVAIVPLAVMTLARGLKGQFGKHVKIARITLPVWLYVSVTGVLVYWMLYQM